MGERVEQRRVVVVVLIAVALSIYAVVVFASTAVPFGASSSRAPRRPPQEDDEAAAASRAIGTGASGERGRSSAAFDYVNAVSRSASLGNVDAAIVSSTWRAGRRTKSAAHERTGS